MMMDYSPRVERFTTVTAGDCSATLLYAYRTNVGSRHLPLVHVRMTSKLKQFVGFLVGRCSVFHKLSSILAHILWFFYEMLNLIVTICNDYKTVELILVVD